MGLRHMVVVDSNHAVVGMITRKDVTERRLDLHWYREGRNLQKFIHVDALPQAIVYEDQDSTEPTSDVSPSASLYTANDPNFTFEQPSADRKSVV